MYNAKIQNFEGPLDLLLRLIEQQKMEITEISLGQVTDQFLLHIEKLEDRDPEELADFLVVATRLLMMKSRAILPVLQEEEDLDDLEKQLRMYKEYVDASKKIEAMLKAGRFTYSRTKPPFELKVEFSPAKNITQKLLRETFLTVLKRLDPLVKLPRTAIAKTLSLQQKVLQLKEVLDRVSKVGFREYFKSAKNKTEIIVGFLAILELIKHKQLRVKQVDSLEDVILEKI